MSILPIIITLLFFILPNSVGAIYNPTSTPNNRYGVHILEPVEITEAAKLANSSGGDWGYVTIPIRSDDRDYEKWHAFFVNANKLRIIPIIRLATYVYGDYWEKPDVFDLVDFANFLNIMPWPTQNRYVVLFNEPNHAKEWGGGVNPIEYANLLIDARDIFKSRSDNFFLLSAGLDMSAPTNSTSLDALKFYHRMGSRWINAIDGLSVHAYPNPGFSASPFSKTRYGITSYKLEKLPSKPIFITETGSYWPSGFYPAAFQIWNDPDIAAITPFLLFAGAGDFTKFSLRGTAAYEEIRRTPKIGGSPLLTPGYENIVHVPTLAIKDTKIKVDLADSPEEIVQGLSGREIMSEDSGMLFVFSKAQKQTFWMKDMLFPLDFIWIFNNKIVQIDKNIPPPTITKFPKIIRSSIPIDRVLEVNSGFVEKHGINVGDEVDFRP